MQIKIHKGRVDLSGTPILTDINIEINTNSRIAVVGRNGCGKTTLIKAISGLIPLSNTPSDGGFISRSGNISIGMLDQLTFSNENRPMIDEIKSAYSEILELKASLDAAQTEMELEGSEESIKKYTSLLELFTNLGGFYFEKEMNSGIKKFGFSDEDKLRPVSEFSGGQRTKLAFLKLLLSKPDLLLLDEPTNHLDIEAVMWLEEYLASYKKAVLIVSHDRMFLDKTVNVVYEIENGKTHKYAGNYTEFTQKKKQAVELYRKNYEAQQKEIKRISDTAERFRYKATKASMAQSKLKQIDRMEKLSAPEAEDLKSFSAAISIDTVSEKNVFSCNELSIGFDRELSRVSLQIFRGDRVAVIGGNGLGKSTFLKTITGIMPPLSGEYRWGNNVKIGYFDQQMAQYRGSETVFENFSREYPQYNDFEVRSALGAFLFSGEDVFKTVDKLSGGERVRLSLCKIFRKNPNVLILDEPTNHMDIISKETLEEIISTFEGTVIFVSHDRYFVKKLARGLLCFSAGGAEWYEYGFEQYLQSENTAPPSDKASLGEKPVKKSYTTPLKEKAKHERLIAKLEKRISELEQETEAIKAELSLPQNISDYKRLEELSEQLQAKEEMLLMTIEEWEKEI